MNRQGIVFAIILSLCLAGMVYGLATEQIGPDKPDRPTYAQDDWPKGIVEVLRHESRVYSRWVNGNENFYFRADAKEVNKLVALFGNVRMEEHEVWIKSGLGKAKTFDGEGIDYNVRLHVPSGIYLHFARQRGESGERWAVQPRLTIHIGRDMILWNQLKIPDNVVVKDESGLRESREKRTSKAMEFVLSRPVDVNLICPAVAGVNGRMAYPLAVETVEFKEVGANLHCFVNSAEMSTAKAKFAVRIEVLGGEQTDMNEQLLGRKEMEIGTELTGLTHSLEPLRKPYELNLGPKADLAGAERFQVSIEHIEPWSEAADGLRVRLAADKRIFTAGEPVSLTAELSNSGTKELLVAGHESAFELVINGQRYRWKKTPSDADQRYKPLSRGHEPVSVAITLYENEWVATESGQHLSEIKPGPVAIQAIARAPEVGLVGSNVVKMWVQKKMAKVRRRPYYGQVQFEDGSPAVSFGLGIRTFVTRWDQGVADGIGLGGVDREGYFKAYLSNDDMKRLQAGQAWLTVTVGHRRREADRNNLRFSTELLSLEREKAGAVTVSRPPIYYGRILFEDGSPAVLDQVPWPGARIHLDAYPGNGEIDAEGYFRLCLTDGMLKQLKAQKRAFGIYYPLEERGRGRSVAQFPVELLSTDKSKAGVIKIYKHIYHFQTDPGAAPSLLGKPLPEMEPMSVDPMPEQAKGKMILVCFWDVNQRPSRHCVRQLAKKVEELSHEEVTVIGFHVGKAAEKALREWMTENKIPLPLGMVQADANKTRFAWGAKGLPWLILTDRQHIVRAEGFGLAELDENLNALVE